MVGRGVKSQLLRLVPKLALGGESGFPYDETKCWLGVDHIKRLRHCWSGNRRCVVMFFHSLHVGSLHVGSSLHVGFRHAMSRQRISGLSSAGAWDSIWHTHIFCASPTVSDSPSPSPGTPLPSLTARIVPWRQACAYTHMFTFVSLETRHVL